MKVILKTVDNFRNYHYAVEFICNSQYRDNTELFCEIRKWLKIHNIPNREHSMDPIWFLETRNDALLFMLRWVE